MVRKRKQQPEIKLPEVKKLDSPTVVKTESRLTEKDRQILSEVDRIIWNPDLLNKFKNDGKVTAPDGLAKNKKDARKV